MVAFCIKVEKYPHTTVPKKDYNEDIIIAQLKKENLRAGAFSAIVEEHSESIYWHILLDVALHKNIGQSFKVFG